MIRTYQQMLRDLLTTIGRDCPAAMAAIITECGGLTMSVAVGDERFGLRVRAEGITTGPVDDPTLDGQTTPRTLAAVVMGEVELDTAMRADDVHLRGPAADLGRLDRMVRLIVAGAARSRVDAGLLDSFLAGSQG